MLSLARDLEHIASVPKIKLRKERERSATFTAELEQAFLGVAPQPLKDVFLISEDSGLRPDETIRMRWDNILFFNEPNLRPVMERRRRLAAMSR